MGWLALIILNCELWLCSEITKLCCSYKDWAFWKVLSCFTFLNAYCLECRLGSKECI